MTVANTVRLRDPMLSDTVRHYLAGAALHQNVLWDKKIGGFRYYLEAGSVPDLREKMQQYVQRLPLVVPGLQVIHSEISSNFDRSQGHIWFTWSPQAMWARYRELYETYGVADERLAYRTCHGTIEDIEGQQRLSQVPEVEPFALYVNDGSFFVSYTPYALREIDSAFCYRMLHPNSGGPSAVPFVDERAKVGNKWWLVGSRGDSPDILALEIQCSPLNPETKENLLDNLRGCDFSESPKFPP